MSNWRERQDGYSMVELMVALATTLVVAAASFALMGSSINFANATYYLTDAEQSSRSAHEIINRDLTTAGDGLRGIGTITAPVSFVQNYLTRTPVTCNSSSFPCVGLVTSDDAIPSGTAIPQSSPAVNFLNNTDRISMLIQDTSFNNGNTISLMAGKITISGSNTNFVVAASEVNLFRTGEIYATVSQNSAAFFVVSSINTNTYTLTATNGDVYGINQNSSTSSIYQTAGIVGNSSTQPVAVMRLQIIQYFVDANGLLKRRVFGVSGAGFMDTVVAEHVTNLQFRYMTNLTDSNGFVKQPLRVLGTSAEQTAVRQVETTVGVETLRAVNGVTDSNSATSVCGANPNGKQNICSTTLTTVRNLQFRQALSP